jgi:serine protease inhibitor
MGERVTSTAVRAANDLAARWARAACTGAQTVLSAAGLWPLLALLAAAAEGPGREELQAAVGVDAAGADGLARALLDQLATSTSVHAALGLWTSAEVPLEPWWQAAAPAGTRGRLTGDLAADQARLDEWAAGHTGGLVARLPVSLNADTLLVLATALSVRTRWREPFGDLRLRVHQGPWAGRDPAPAGLTRSSRDLDQLAVAATPVGLLTLLAVEGTADVDVQLVLGEQGRAAGEVLAAGIGAVAGAHATWRGAQLLDASPAPGLEVAESSELDGEPKLRVTAVRFTVAAAHDLTADAELFGLSAVSDRRRGHFPRISRFPLALQQARQDATATFSAEGFEAAAVTAFGMAAGAAVLQRARSLFVRFDRPFGFLACHRPTGLVLVAGWVAEPEAWSGEDHVVPA